MKIYIGTDHAGFDFKEELTKFLEEQGYIVEDKGAFVLDPEDDYPDFIVPVAQAVSADSEAKGIVLGGSGQGEALVANKFKGVRAAVYYGGDLDIVALSRKHNDANVLALGARFLSLDDAKESVLLWLKTEFSGEERHVRRLDKVGNL